MKKRNAHLLIAVTSLFFISACANSSEKIKDCAYGYSYALANYNIEEAELYCTPETKESTLQYALHLMENIPAEYIKSDTPAAIEIKNISITSDTTATVDYHKHTPIKDFDASLNMVKRHGKWLAHDPIHTEKTDTDNGGVEMVADTAVIHGKKVQLFHFNKKDTVK